MAEKLIVSGARGASVAEMARRTGTFLGTAVSPFMSDAEVLDAPLGTINESVAAATAVKPIAPVRVATTAAITRSGLPIVDGVQLVEGDRVLDKDATSAASRGVYVATASGFWPRATDFDSAGEASQGSYVVVLEGTQAGAWILATPDPITIGTTEQSWQPFRFSSLSKTAYTASFTGAAPQSGARKLDQIAFVTDFGTVTGLNDTNVLNAAIASGKSIVIPAGLSVQTFGDVNLQPGQMLVGQGLSSKLYLQTNRAGNNIKVRLANDSSVQNLFVEEVGTIGRTGLYGTIFGEGVSNTSVIGCEVSGSSSIGIMFIDSTDCIVTGNNVHDCMADGVHAQRGCKRVIVQGNLIRRVGDDGVAFVSHGVDAYGPVTDCEASNNIITDIQMLGSGIAVIGAFRVSIVGNTIDTVPLAGIRIASASYGAEGSTIGGHIHVADNSISNAGGGPALNVNGGIFAEGVRYLTIANNKIFKPKTWGIALANAVIDAVVSNNTITATGEVAIFISFGAQSGYYRSLWTNELVSDGTPDPGFASGDNIAVNDNSIRSSASSGIYINGDATRRINGLSIERNQMTRLRTNADMGNAYAIFVQNADVISMGGNISRNPANPLIIAYYLNPTNCSGFEGVENTSVPRIYGLSPEARTWDGVQARYCYTAAPTSSDAAVYGTYPAGTFVKNANPSTGVHGWDITADVTASSPGSFRTVVNT